MELRTVDFDSIRGKRVLVRVDFNVPLKNGAVSDDTRIRAHRDTVERLRKSGAIVALVSHLGRPKGKPNQDYSLKQVLSAAESVLGPISFVDDCVGKAVSDALEGAVPGSLFLLENTRFYAEEEKNDQAFSKEMAIPFDLFVLDAFSAAHRAHSSTVGVQAFLPSFAGKLLCDEITSLAQVRDNPKRPFALILGGAKVSDKIGVIENLMDKVSSIFIGGGMAFTFIKVGGGAIGSSIVDENNLNFARDMLNKAQNSGVTVFLPVDVVAASSTDSDAVESIIVPADSIPQGMMGLDIGPETIASFSKGLEGSKTILWNGPSGVFENEAFSSGTLAICEAVASETNKGAFSVVGGGDTAAAVASMGFVDRVSHVSTGGGASLEFCEGKVLPGVAPLIRGQ